MDQKSWMMIRQTAEELARLLTESAEMRAKLVKIEHKIKKRPNYGLAKRVDKLEARLEQLESMETKV